jgi:hypothetical protein
MTERSRDEMDPWPGAEQTTRREPHLRDVTAPTREQVAALREKAELCIGYPVDIDARQRLLAACSPEVIRALCDMAEECMAWRAWHDVICPDEWASPGPLLKEARRLRARNERT